MSGEELSGEIAGQKFSAKNLPINTLATVATLVLVSIIAYVLYQHEVHAANRHGDYLNALREQTQAIREAAQAQRETTCINTFPESQREAKSAFCKQISR